MKRAQRILNLALGQNEISHIPILNLITEEDPIAIDLIQDPVHEGITHY